MSTQSVCVGALCKVSQPAFLFDAMDFISSSPSPSSSSSSAAAAAAAVSALPPFVLIGSDAPVDPVLFMP
jgi:hypothetical protein